MQAKQIGTATATATATPPPPKPDMFCFQCEQTEHGTGCTVVGVCGKTPEVSSLQDLLIHQLKGISFYMIRARKLGGSARHIDDFILPAMFSTLTNVNFDPTRFVEFNKTASKYLAEAKALYEAKAKETKQQTETIKDDVLASVKQNSTVEDLEKLGEQVGVLGRRAMLGEDISGLQELIVYGLKGLSAYADHALYLGKYDPEVVAFVYEALDGVGYGNLSADGLLGLALRVGECNFKVMALLEDAATSTYGHPTPTTVRTTAVKGKCILVSGHDLRDLHDILVQTEGTGINVYTHGELLPGHGYPELKKFKHLVGNYGGAWQLQKMDFALFPGPIVMTTNCLIEPKQSYKNRIFTRSVVGWPGVQHIPNDDFSKVIEAAKAAKGFEKDETPRFIQTGFGRNTVLSIAGQVIDAVKAGTVKHFFFIGGCDGSEGERNYFKELALNSPKDSMILTAGCGKYRFNKFDFGTVGGLPRLVDMGQCNDAYGAIQVGLALAKAFNTDVNSLPLSFAVSWFEQKAVAVLLTLLHLNVQNIHLGPHLPGFATPAILRILQEKFQLRPISPDVRGELDVMLKNHK